jgi:hypothetical protein
MRPSINPEASTGFNRCIVADHWRRCGKDARGVAKNPEFVRLPGSFYRNPIALPAGDC